MEESMEAGNGDCGQEESGRVEENFHFERERKPVKQGAEARLYETVYLGKKAIVKQRFAKSYRHAILDSQLNKQRIRAEVKGIMKAKQIGVDTPAIYFIEGDRNEMTMERIEGMTAKEWIEKRRREVDGDTFENDLKSLGSRVGIDVGKMHGAGLVHGDLTTSNVLLRGNDPQKIVFIDFGLCSQMKITGEEKGVDLYVLERAVASTHHNSSSFFRSLLESYKESGGKAANQALCKLDEVRLRGRKRDMVG